MDHLKSAQLSRYLFRVVAIAGQAIRTSLKVAGRRKLVIDLVRRAVDDHHSAPPERIEKRPVLLVEEHLDYFPAADPSADIVYYLGLSPLGARQSAPPSVTGQAQSSQLWTMSCGAG